MKKELIIKQKGLFLRLTGITPFRTPAKVDISRLNMTLLLSELNINSVIDFQIISNSKEEKKKEKTVPELLENLKSNSKEIKKNDINVKKELNEIKSLLKNLLDKPSTVTEKIIYESSDKIESKKYKRKKKISDDFIPTVNIDHLEMKKGSEINTIKSDIDISDNVDLLSRISKRKEKKND